MSDFAKNTIIIAAFANESASVGALAGLEHWADTRKDIHLGTIGAMHKEGEEITTAVVRKADKGFLVSGAMGLAKAMLGPLLLVGNVAGGVAKSVLEDGDEETPAAIKKLGAYLDAGRASLIMVGSLQEAVAYAQQLEVMCGAVLLHEVPQEVLQEAADAAAAAQAQQEAAEKAQKEADKAQKEAEKAQKEAEKAQKEAEKESRKKDDSSGA